jgi:ubiquinone/menaquinone biosynthesis C-methylase UbiE
MTAQTPGGSHADPTTASNRATYDRIAVRYAENQDRLVSGNERAFPDLLRAFAASIPARGTVADLGCGPARDATRFAEAGFNVLGMDLSAGMLDMAPSAMDGRLVQADLRALPIRASTLDGIWCCAALLHVPENDTLTVLREFRRTLTSGGALALVTALGDGARFEPVPYAPTEQRWFAYRTAFTIADQLRSVDFTIHTSTRVKGNRDWGLVLAAAP